MTALTRSTALWGLGWSAAFLLVSRLSAVAAVPLVLDSVGSALYGVWVIGGVLIMVQGLFDAGVGAALVRFVATGAARNSRPAVLTVFIRALVFYLLLSALVSIPVWIWAPELASLVSSLKPAEEGQAVTLIRYAAVAFALTNVTLVLSSLLQGVGRVDAAYRAQTLGWLIYVPVLVIGLHVSGSSQAIGLAWVCAYGLQVVLLSGSGYWAITSLSTQGPSAPPLKQMLSLGGWWQLSSWADFTTLQLPRLAGGFVLAAGALVALDVALRAAQLVVAPFFAAYPLVLPAAARTWTVGGAQALRDFLNQWFLGGVIALWLLATAFVPLERPLLAAWTGRPADSFNIWLCAAVLLGITAHASTGLFSSARLATGDISPVLRYKKRQLVLGLLLIPPALLGGATTTGLALGIALTAPALAFNRDESRAFHLHLPSRRAPVVFRLVAATALALALPAFAAWLLDGLLPAWALVVTLIAVWAATSVVAWLWCWSSWARRESAASAETEAKVERVAS
jgi:O-antigen/teichoic acid export membrane protein